MAYSASNDLKTELDQLFDIDSPTIKAHDKKCFTESCTCSIACF
ncbi:hypothetical protein Hmuk_0791 [Halomicrobium mukohataei DSM 12286]|uniref:Uncharacterized protein n=1 Tax=Halomicrobium mukohataei (strain ATCC 700874 / DSM 12286 / JCM 9738 / NCIMB 13541) TaxID=485914 RepID=C7P014_HALMD|nr:hypothetical protein Hmuk_0791 [Halomicrobium mukohataei DSM 12286]